MNFITFEGMTRIVILNESQIGRSFNLKDGITTVGRIDDNAFAIAEPSVSSHHCEIIGDGSGVVIRDLNSTNGTFINDQQVTTEMPLKPGQILRLGQVELRLEDSAPPHAPSGAFMPAKPPISVPSQSSEIAHAQVIRPEFSVDQTQSVQLDDLVPPSLVPTESSPQHATLPNPAASKSHLPLPTRLNSPTWK
jgi:predicted component of type VI protein secretion system